MTARPPVSSATNASFQANTLVELLRWRAVQQPESGGYTFLVDGESHEVHLSFAELDRRARAVAHLLDARSASQRTVLLVFPSGLEFIIAFFGCLYAGAVPATVYPPRPNRSLERFSVIASDSGASLIFTTQALRDRLEPVVAGVPGFNGLVWLSVDDGVELDAPRDWNPPRVDEDSLAFLQYTSGSTAEPKGVMVTHGNVLHNSRLIGSAFESTAASVGVGWLPMTHDMGLIGNVVQPLFSGCRIVFMAPEHFLVKPIRWLEAISRYQASLSGGPNFAYDLCTQRIREDHRQQLDLSSWAVAFNGAEPVRSTTLDRFTAAFSGSGFRRTAFYPCYGLAESTLMVTGGIRAQPPVEVVVDSDALQSNRVIESSADDPRGRRLISCGHGRLHQEAIIVDPVTRRRCPEACVGEIWVAGPSVATGYWKQPEASAERFRACLQNGEGPYLRTGDLGFLREGELFVTGRLKDLIIISGANHFPVDIETTVEQCHPAIRDNAVAAISVEVQEVERLVIVAEVDRHRAETGAVQATVREAVARRHDLSVHEICLIRQSTLPRTSSGKIQRHLCRRRYLDGALMPADATKHDTRL